MKKAFTLIELLVTIVLISLLSSALFLYINPKEYLAKARDARRLTDVGNLDSAVIRYFFETGFYPDVPDTTRYSNVISAGCTSLYSSACGWLNEDLATFITKLPTDPVNDDLYRYSYRNNGSSYEINAYLEILNEFEMNDGGDNADAYEIGNNINLL